MMVSPFIMIPLYMFPQNGAWNFLYQSIEAHPDLPVVIIINIDSGPGAPAGTYPGSDWVKGLSRLNSYNNTQLLGYVHTLEASRPWGAAAGDIEAYASWASYKDGDIHMDGIFFDESPWVQSAENLTYIQNITDFARSKIPNAYTTLNPGIPITEDFYAMCTNVVALEDYYSEFSISLLEDVPAELRNNSVVMMHHFTGSSSEQAQIVDMVVQEGIPGVYITTKDDYHSGSKKWKEFSAAVAGDVIGATQSSLASSMISSPGLLLSFIFASVTSLML